MTVPELIELLRGYMVERVPLSIPSLINTLCIHNIPYAYGGETTTSGTYYKGTASSILILDHTNRYCIVIMGNKVVSIDHRKIPEDTFLSYFDNFF